MNKTMKHLRLFAVLLLGGLLFSSCEEIEKLDRETRERNLKNLQEWVVNSTTSQEAINQFGYEKCFTITTIGEYYWTDFMNYYAGDKSVITKDQLAAVLSLFYDKQMMDPIKIGEIICNKSISSDLLDIFRKLYEAHYSITELMPVGIATYERVTEDVNAYYGPTFSFQYMGDNVWSTSNDMVGNMAGGSLFILRCTFTAICDAGNEGCGAINMLGAVYTNSTYNIKPSGGVDLRWGTIKATTYSPSVNYRVATCKKGTFEPYKGEVTYSSTVAWDGNEYPIN